MSDAELQDKYADVDEMRAEMRSMKTRSEILNTVGYGCIAVVGAIATAAQTLPFSSILAGAPAVVGGVAITSSVLVAGMVIGAATVAVGAACMLMGWREKAEIDVLSEEINSSLNAEKIGKKIGEVLHEKQMQPEKEIAHYPQNQRADGKSWMQVTAQPQVVQQSVPAR